MSAPAAEKKLVHDAATIKDTLTKNTGIGDSLENVDIDEHNVILTTRDNESANRCNAVLNYKGVVPENGVPGLRRTPKTGVLLCLGW